jgi:hypothetical protein
MARFVGTKVEFGADTDELVLNLDARELPLIHSDPYLNDLLLKYCKAALAAERRWIEQAHGSSALGYFVRRRYSACPVDSCRNVSFARPTTMRAALKEAGDHWPQGTKLWRERTNPVTGSTRLSDIGLKVMWEKQRTDPLLPPPQSEEAEFDPLCKLGPGRHAPHPHRPGPYCPSDHRQQPLVDAWSRASASDHVVWNDLDDGPVGTQPSAVAYRSDTS